MLSITKIRLTDDGIGSASYLEGAGRGRPEDYYYARKSYIGGERRVIEALGLDPDRPPSLELMAALMRGQRPSTGEYLIRAGDDRVAGWDLTFSAPKSVSIEWQCGGGAVQTDIESAHDAAVRAAMAYIVEWVESRTGAGGTGRMKSSPILSLHRHGTSRSLDPQLHTHCFVYNLALCDDGQYRTIVMDHIYRHKSVLAAIYRAELAKNLRTLGYAIEPDEDSFRIAGVSRDIEREFSRRTIEIEQYIKAKGLENTPENRKKATLASRQNKIEVDPDLLREEWLSRAAAYQYQSSRGERQQHHYDREAFLASLTERQSYVSEIELRKRILIAHQHAGLGVLEAETELEHLLEAGEIVLLQESDVPGRAVFTTRQQLETELDLMATAREMRESEVEDNFNVEEIAQEFSQCRYALSDEQKDALREMLTQRLAIIRGVAGAGKTSSAEAAYQALSRAGYRVLGVAIAARAARGLASASDYQSTVARLLIDLDRGRIKLDDKTVLMLDEAGMVGSRTMEALLRHARDAGARVILIGDEKQIQPIEAGGAFAAIQKIVAPDRAEITQIRRQRTEVGRAISAAAERGDYEQAVSLLESLDAIHYGDMDSAVEAAADKYLEYSQAGSVLALASTRADVARLNAAIRAKLGITGGEKINTAFGEREFCAGDRVIVRKNATDLGVVNGDTGVILSADAHGIKIRLDTGKEVHLPPEYTHVDYGYAITTHAAQGATVDRAVVLATDGPLTAAELGYVQMTRHREELYIASAMDREALIAAYRRSARSKTAVEVVLDREI